MPNRWRSIWPLCCLLLVGCASPVRMPAIDPTGQQILLPQPAYTTLESPLASLGTTSAWPRPAFTQPPRIPPCPPSPTEFAQPVPSAPLAAQAVPPAVGIGVPNLETLQDRLVLSPARIVAPVDSEVILLAGICGPDGYYVTRQPIEWSLSQQSVGQFVDVGETRHETTFRLSPHGPQKLSNDFALTRTSTAARPITRGTPSPHDDVWLQKGQAWVSVTSASPGVSLITAVATGAENWDQRRQLARVHWVDAEWLLPSPAVVKAGTVHTLTTQVSRSSNGQPVEGWTVRYEVVDGAAAAFGETGQTQADVRTDENGLASVTLAQTGNNSGSTRISIRIRSPANGDQPVEVGQGWTTVTWSAPGLDVNVSGPDVATPDSTLTYQIEVSNPGDLAVHNVTVTAVVPPRLQFLNADPPATQSFGDNQIWRLETLAPGQTQSIAANCRALSEGPVRFRATARADGISAERQASAATEILAQSIDIRIVDPPRAAVIGKEISFNVEVTNVGTRALSNVVVVDTFDTGLEHAAGESSPIRKSLGTIEVGASSRFAVTFIPGRAGNLCHTLEISADGGHFAAERACVTVEEPRVGLRVDKYGAERAYLGDVVQFTIEVTNTGEAPLTNVHIVDDYPAAIDPQRASDGYRHTDNGLEWVIPTLAPNTTEVREATYLCLAAGRFVENRIVVTADQVARQTASATLVIEPRPADPAGPPTSVRRPPTPAEEESPAVDDAAPDGLLTITLAQSNPAAAVGDTLTYTIEVHNGQDVADKAVEVSFVLPDGVAFRRFNSVSAELSLAPPQKGRYQIERIAEMRPKGKRQFEIEVVAQQPGEQTLQVSATSLRSSAAVTEEIVTSVRD